MTDLKMIYININNWFIDIYEWFKKLYMIIYIYIYWLNDIQHWSSPTYGAAL